MSTKQRRKEIDAALEAFGSSTDLAGALAKLSDDLDRDVTYEVVRGWFRRANLDPPCTHLGKKPRANKEPIADPDKLLEERASSKTTKRLKTERDALLDRLAEANERASFVDAIRRPIVPVIERRETTSGLREGALVVLASDWHIEETVDPASIAGINEYNLKIAKERINRFWDSIEWALSFERHAFKIRDLVLWLGGDLFSGHIHEELVETTELSPVESVLFLKSVISGGIHRLLQDSELERIAIPCSYGNHGRTTPKKRISTGAKNSFEWLLYQILKDEFKHEKRVEFTAEQSAHQYVQCFGELLHFTHGDEVDYKGGIGGITIPVNKRIPAWDRVKSSAIHHFGHFHQLLSHDRFVANGSLIGFSPYSQKIGASPEPPRQASYVLDSRNGKTCVTPLWVAGDGTTP